MRSPTEAMAWLKGETKRREEALRAARDSAKREAASIKIQCFVRIFVAKNAARALIQAAEIKAETRNTSATKIQSAFRAKLARKELIRRQNAKLDAEMKNASAAKIQAQFRGKLARRQFKNTKDLNKKRELAAIMLQCAWRTHKARQELEKLKHLKRCVRSAIIIQAMWRALAAYRVVKRKLNAFRQEVANGAALVLQGQARKLAARKRFAEKKAVKQRADEEAAARLIQKIWRGELAKRAVHAKIDVMLEQALHDQWAAEVEAKLKAQKEEEERVAAEQRRAAARTARRIARREAREAARKAADEKAAALSETVAAQAARAGPLTV